MKSLLKKLGKLTITHLLGIGKHSRSMLILTQLKRKDRRDKDQQSKLHPKIIEKKSRLLLKE